MKLSLGLVTAMPFKESVELAKAAEKAGYYRIWVGEDIFYRDIFTYLAVISLNTKDIGIGSGITSPYVRNNHIIASSGISLSELSGGRFSYGLGVGGLPEVERFTGERPKRSVAVLENAVLFLKEKLDIEVYLGVRGPRMLELAGRVADGVILSGPRGYIENAIDIVDAASAGRERVKKVLWNAFFLGENPKLVENVTSVVLESMPEFALKYMDKERIVEALCIHGSKEQVIEEIEGFEEMGIDEFVIGPPYGSEPLKTIEEMGG